jgi:uncharacterized protein YgbK (DUF1537 family)
LKTKKDYPQKILVIADDLTGSVDTGVQFRKRKLKTVVITGSENMAESFHQSDVVVVDTESRFDDKISAYTKAFETASTAKSLNISHFYKKLDSTMRGNPGAEISAIMDALDISVTFLVPALPLYGRTTIDGKVLVNGIPLAETQYAKDPKNPVNESYIPAILSKQTDKKISVISLETVRKGKEFLEQSVSKSFKKGTRIILIDSETDADIELVADVIAARKERKMYAGCSGLAEKLAPHLTDNKKNRSNFVIAGSVNKITANQLTYAADKLGITIVDINPLKVLSKKKIKEKKRIINLAGEAAAAGNDLIIRSAASVKEVTETLEKGRKKGLDDFRVSDIIADFIGETVAEIIRKYKLNGVVLTGGDTAIKTLSHLNVNGIEITDEIVHGIPYGHFSKKKYSDLTVVTKAGGFGSEDAVRQIINFLRNE